MKRVLASGAIIGILLVSFVNFSSGASTTKVTSRIPSELKVLILNTLDSVNLRIEDVVESVEKDQRQTSSQSWDYQRPNRAESIPRRVLVAHHYYGTQIEVRNVALSPFSIGDPGLGTGLPVVASPKYVEERLPSATGQWTDVQFQLFSPLIDALNGNRYVQSNNGYVFSTQNGIMGRVTVNGRRVLRAQINYFQSLCSGMVFMKRETETFYGIEHFATIVLPPSSVIQRAKTGKVTLDGPVKCKH
jgi:hypothetical protein